MSKKKYEIPIMLTLKKVVIKESESLELAVLRAITEKINWRMEDFDWGEIGINREDLVEKYPEEMKNFDYEGILDRYKI